MCNKFKEELGKNIKRLRKEKNLSQEKISLETGISRSYIAMIESGKRDVTISVLFKISRALKVDMKEIFSYDNKDLFKFDADELYL